MSVQLITNEQLDALEAQRTALINQLPEIEKAIKANLLTTQALTDAKGAISRIEGILNVYRPASLAPARGTPRR